MPHVELTGLSRNFGRRAEPRAHPSGRRPPLYAHPADCELPACHHHRNRQLLTLDLGAGARPFPLTPRNTTPQATKAELGVRPDHATLTAPDALDAVLPTRIRLVERLGNQTLYRETVAGPVTLHGPATCPPVPATNPPSPSPLPAPILLDRTATLCHRGDLTACA